MLFFPEKNEEKISFGTSPLPIHQELASFTQGTTENIEIEYIQENIAGKSYLSHCLVRCDLPLRLQYRGTSAPNTYALKPTDLSKYLYFDKGTNDDILTFGIEYLVQETYDVTIEDWGVCDEKIIFNQTTGKEQTLQTSCITGTHQEQRIRFVWKELTEDIQINKNEYFYLNFYLIKKASLKKFAVDIVPSLTIADFKANLSEFAWWNSSWDKKIEINITENAGSTVTDYSVRLNISYDADMQADFDDLRFLNQNEDTELSYWIERKINSVEAIAWVKVDLTASSPTRVYMYYSNPTAASTSNINTSFVLGDNFDFNDTSKWTQIAQGDYGYYYNNGILNQSAGTSTPGSSSLKSVNLYGLNKSIVALRFLPSGVNNQGIQGVGFSRCHPQAGEDSRPCNLAHDNVLRWRYSTGGDTHEMNNNLNIATTAVLKSLTEGTWQYYELARIDNQSMARDDYGGWTSNFGNYNKTTMNAVITQSTGYGLNASVDLAFVREFVFPEPTYVIGSEQSDPADTNVFVTAQGGTFNIDQNLNASGNLYVSTTGTVSVVNNLNLTSNNMTSVDCIITKRGGKICSL